MKQITLNPTASLIWTAITIYGQEYLDAPVPMQMAVIGCGNRDTFSRARRELAEQGFVELTPGSGRKPLTLQIPRNVINKIINILLNYYNPSVPTAEVKLSMVDTGDAGGKMMIIHQPVASDVTTPVTEVTTSYTNLATPLTEVTKSAATVDTPMTEVTTSEATVDTPLTEVTTSSTKPLRVRCFVADQMDGSGDMMDTKSPFQVRRRVQMELVQEMWSTLFPAHHPLTSKSIKEFLNAMDNCCADILIEMERVAERVPNLQDPMSAALGYMKRVFESKPKTVVVDQSKPSGDLSNQFSKAPSKSEIREPDTNDPYVQKLLALRAKRGLDTNIEIAGRH